MNPDLTTAQGCLAYAAQLAQQTAALRNRPGMTDRKKTDS